MLATIYISFQLPMKASFLPIPSAQTFYIFSHLFRAVIELLFASSQVLSVLCLGAGEKQREGGRWDWSKEASKRREGTVEKMQAAYR